MENESEIKTNHILYEVSFNNNEPYGNARVVSQVNPQGPVFIIFPGNAFKAKEKENIPNEKVLKMANKLKKYLELANIDKDIIKHIPFYVICYDTPDDFSDKDARTLLYKKHGRKINMPEKVMNGENGFSEEEKNPAYIEKLYHQLVEARISRLNGKIKIDTDSAERNMAQVFMFAHCHGAYTALKLEEVMKRNMRKLNYTNEEICKIQKHITAVAYAPACPLGVSKMNFISFKSLNDTETHEDYNNASVYASMQIDSDRKHWADIHLAKTASSEAPFDFKLSFYPDTLGNVFVIKQKSNYESIIQDDNGEYYADHYNLMEKEHNNIGAGETEDSKNMFKMMINVLANACRHSFRQAKQQKLLDPLLIQELVVGTINPKEDAKIFNNARHAGIEQAQMIKIQIAKLLAEQRN